MKNIFSKSSFKAMALVVLSGMFAGHAMAQTSVSIKVNPNAKVTVANQTPATQCPEQGTPGAGTASYKFQDLASLAGVTATNNTGEIKYYATRTGTAPNYSYVDEITDNQYILEGISTGNNTKTIYVIAISSGCSNDTSSFDLSVYAFPNISISGGGASECAGSIVTYTASATTDISSYAWTVTGGTLTGGGTTLTETTGSVEVTWGAAGAGTLSLTYTTSNNCIFTTQDRNITINPLPVITTTSIATCYAATVDLTAAVTEVTNADKATVEYSTSATDFDANKITSPAAYTNTTTAGDQTIYVKVTGTCTSEITSFTLTVYPDITAQLEVVTGGNATAYEACDNGTNSVTLKITVTGGCPTAPNYSVTLNVGTGITLGASTDDVTINGNVLTIDRTKANTGVTFTITATSGTDATIDVVSVAQDGTAPCNCSKTL